MTAPPSSQSGFTLVEMVVALLIFGVLASAGVGLLRASVDTQEAVSRTLADLGAAARLRVLLSGDLGQAVVRPLAAAPNGFAGTGGDLTVVRAFEPAERLGGEPGLRAVRWRLVGTDLVRETLRSDRSQDAAAAVLARDVTTFAVRFRAADGEWRSQWRESQTEAVLPAAVELTVMRRGEAPLRLVVALPQGNAPVIAPSAAVQL